MNLEQLITHTRNNVLRDEAEPHLWGDEELTLYFNQAEQLFARRTHCLIAEDGPLSELPLLQGEQAYALNPKTVAIIAVYDNLGTIMRDVSRGKVKTRWMSGRPTAYSTDAAVKTIRFVPTPDDDYEVSMVVAHKPLNDLANPSDTPSIPEEYHLFLCDYVAYMALRNNDPEQSQMAAADMFRAQWEESVREAKRELHLLRNGANPRAVRSWTGKYQR